MPDARCWMFAAKYRLQISVGCIQHPVTSNQHPAFTSH
jgi:hypothetical protein